METRAASTLTTNMEGPGEPTVEPIEISTVMKAVLSSVDGFEVSPISEEEQFVSDDTFTEWIWNVLPLKSGMQKLELRVSVKVIR